MGVIGKNIAAIGRNSLDVYLFHGFFLSMFNLELFGNWIGRTSNYVIELIVLLVISFIVAVLSLLLGIIIKQSCFLSKFIYGKY